MLDDLQIYRRAKAITELGNKISDTPVKISDVYQDLLEIHAEVKERAKNKAARLPPRD